MKLNRTTWTRLAIAAITSTVLAAPLQAQTPPEQFIPALAYRSGPYAPNGIPWANGKLDYYKLINARDGGINGVRIAFEECETGYATDRGVECYERLKSRGNQGAAAIDPQATGILFALTEKVAQDRIPIIAIGYGRSEARDGSVFPWNFQMLGTYAGQFDIAIQHIAEEEGGLDALKGKKIALVYHDSPYGKEPLPYLRERAQRHGFQLVELPVAAPGVEQKSTWLQVRQQKPDWVLLQGWGIMNSTALKEAQAVGFPRNRMIGGFYASAEPDVRESGQAAKGYRGIALHTPGRFAVHDEIIKQLHDQNQGTGPREEVGQVLYNRGLLIGMLTVEAIRRAQEEFGKGQPMTGEQVRWGAENLNLTDADFERLGITGMLRGPLQTSCANHVGTEWARIQTWDGSQWVIDNETWYEPDGDVIDPILTRIAQQYAQEKGIKPACL